MPSATSRILRNPIVLDAALKGIEATKKVAVPTASAGAATDQDQQDNEKEQTPETPISQNENTNGWVPILSGGRRFTIHPEDLAEAQRRDPGLRTIDDARVQGR